MYVKTAIFEGPLDLLLNLISRRKLDITEVSLTELVNEYLEVLTEMQKLDLEVTSEFLLVAATLIQLKTRYLLPGEEVDIDEELSLKSERDRLLGRLLACVTFKDVAAVFSARWRQNQRYFPRTGGLDPGQYPPPPPPEIPVDAYQLAQIAVEVFNRPTPEINLDHIDLELPSVGLALSDLNQRIRTTAQLTFAQIVSDCDQPVEIVAYFLALLELAKWGMVAVSQEHWLADILVTAENTKSKQLDGGSLNIDLLETEWSFPPHKARQETLTNV